MSAPKVVVELTGTCAKVFGAGPKNVEFLPVGKATLAGVVRVFVTSVAVFLFLIVAQGSTPQSVISWVLWCSL